MTKKVAVIGAGNPLFKDEGVGVYAVEHLKLNYSFSQPIEFVDGSTLGMDFVTYITEYDYLFIIQTDTASSKNAGTIGFSDLPSYLEQARTKKTANEVAVGEMMQSAFLFGPTATTQVISIVPEDIGSVEVGLSPTLYNAFPVLTQTILEKLGELHIQATKNKKQIDVLINNQLKHTSQASRR